MVKMNLYVDMEFTGLFKNAEIISIGIVTDTINGNRSTFYGECTDFDRSNLSDFITDEVLPNLMFVDDGIEHAVNYIETEEDEVAVTNVVKKTTTTNIARGLKEWLADLIVEYGVDQFNFVSDVLPYDYVLFCDLFGSSLKLCKYNINYIPLDIATMLFMAGIDPDINREEYCEYTGPIRKHNALHDAKIISLCFNKLMKNNVEV